MRTSSGRGGRLTQVEKADWLRLRRETGSGRGGGLAQVEEADRFR